MPLLAYNDTIIARKSQWEKNAPDRENFFFGPQRIFPVYFCKAQYGPFPEQFSYQ
jgi:hypothetical protein